MGVGGRERERERDGGGGGSLDDRNASTCNIRNPWPLNFLILFPY